MSAMAAEKLRFTLSASNSAEMLRPQNPTPPTSDPSGPESGLGLASPPESVPAKVPASPETKSETEPMAQTQSYTTEILPQTTVTQTTVTQTTAPQTNPPATNPPPPVPVTRDSHPEKPSASASLPLSHDFEPLDSESAIDNEPADEDTQLQFKKKNVKPRTQSLQSVLSTASLKSLNQPIRNNSIISSSNVHNNKNFQSYIQAPVLSLIPNLRSEELEIGRQLPFDEKKQQEKEPKPVINEESSYDDQDTLLQQQRLTLNALKKLSLSPLPRIDDGSREEPSRETRPSPGPVNSAAAAANDDKHRLEPYQPAAVDLSTFSSLTRQPNLQRNVALNSQAPLYPQASLRPEGSPEAAPEELLLAQQKYHHQVAQNQQLGLKVQTKNSLINDLVQRRSLSLPITNRIPSPLHKARNTASSTNIPVMNNPNQNTAVNTNAPANGTRMEPVSSTPEPAGTSGNSQTSPGYFQLKHPTLQNPKLKHLQHIKGLRSPMYVPAVLRKTVDNDEDSSPYGQSQNESSAASLRSVDSSASVESGTSSPMAPAASLRNFKSYEHFLRQPPTRKHWVKDEQVYKCDISLCSKEFNFFERRHHCRKCGGIFCKDHTSHYLYINHLAQFTTGGRGTLSRVCDNCIKEYNEFVKNQFGVSVKENETPRVYEGYHPIPKKHEVADEPSVGSVPANWSWSSF